MPIVQILAAFQYHFVNITEDTCALVSEVVAPYVATPIATKRGDIAIGRRSHDPADVACHLCLAMLFRGIVRAAL